MKNIKYILFPVFAIFMLLHSGCVKTEFDQPAETTYSVDFEKNAEYTMKTIKELKEIYNLASDDTAVIKENYVIKGVVISDDKEGNFYKTMTIQDSTGGISIPVDAYDLYKDFPQGQLLYIKCKGLVLTNYRGSIQIKFLSNLSVESIPAAAMKNYIFKSDGGALVNPKVVTIDELGVNKDLINTLVKLQNVQFAVSDTSKTFYYSPDGYYDAPNRNIKDCSNTKIILRNSEFASFAGQKVPAGNGTIIAISNVYNATAQLFIRDLTDLDMNGERCAE